MVITIINLRFLMRAKILICGLLILGIATSCYAQAAHKKPSSKLAIGHGIGNVWKSFLRDAINADVRAAAGYTITGTGPINVIYEHQIYKKFSGGIQFSYAKVKGDGAYNGFVFSDQLTIYSVLARADYHFYASKRFDSYIGIGGGYVHSKYQNNVNTSSSSVPGEFGYTAQLGARYYFMSRLGIFGELGYVNGSFMQLGIVGKF